MNDYFLPVLVGVTAYLFGVLVTLLMTMDVGAPSMRSWLTVAFLWPMYFVLVVLAYVITPIKVWIRERWPNRWDITSDPFWDAMDDEDDLY